MARFNWVRIAQHVSFWLVYLFLNGVVTCLIHGLKLVHELPGAIWAEAFTLPIKIALTLFLFYYIIPLYMDRSKVGKLILLTLIAFITSTLIYRGILIEFYFPRYKPEVNIQFWYLPGLMLTIFDLYITITAVCTIKMTRMHYKSKEVEEQLIREKLQSELDFLRTQTNPHFLFNTLNNLFVLARKKSDKTADAIMMLSKIMRFVLYDCRNSRIPISDEVKVIKDYIELEKLRYNQRLQVEYEEDLDNPSLAIAPLLLLPFVENSFKHGPSSTVGAAEIHIGLHLANNLLLLNVENTAEDKQEPLENGHKGIGLINVRRQLDLIYGGRYSLETTLENGRYSVNLTLDLREA